MTVPDPDSAARNRPDRGDAPSSDEDLVRRLSWRPVARGIVGLGFLGVVLAGLGVVGVLSGDSMFSVMGVLAALSLASAAGLAFINARARTRIGPEGIVNRAVWTETTIPWEDVAEVEVQRANSQRTVQIRRHGDGATVTLAALRDHPAAPDRHFDETVAVIRRRADAAAEADGAARHGGRAFVPDRHGPIGAVGAYPMTLRPSRRPLLLMLPLAAAATAAVAALVAASLAELPSTHSFSLSMLVVLVVVLWRRVLILLVGWTGVDDQGITDRGALRRRHIPWEEVENLTLWTTLFGRGVMVSVKGRKQLPLAAPHEGLLARAPEGDDPFARLAALAEPHGLSLQPGLSRRATWVVLAVVLLLVGALSLPFEQPWKRPWWPWLHEADDIAQPCALTEAEELVGAPLQESADEPYAARRWTCEWEAPPEEWSSLTVEYELHEYRFNSSGTDNARDAYARSHDFETGRADASDPVDLGEEAVRTVERPSSDGEVSRVTYLVRKANVVVEAAYTAEAPAEEVQAGAEEITREALDRVHVD